MVLVPVADALDRLLAGAAPLPGESVPLAEAMDRVLAEPIRALRTQPPFDASAMDGYAVRAADIGTLPAHLSVIGTAPAGHGFTGTPAGGEAVRIFTGAPLPAGTDTVVIQEDTRDLGNGAIEVVEATAHGANVRKAGLDLPKVTCFWKRAACSIPPPWRWRHRPTTPTSAWCGGRWSP